MPWLIQATSADRKPHAPPHLPASLYLEGIDGTQRLLAGYTNQLSQTTQQGLQLRVSAIRWCLP
jgi:hypothetical protein